MKKLKITLISIIAAFTLAGCTAEIKTPSDTTASAETALEAAITELSEQTEQTISQAENIAEDKNDDMINDELDFSSAEALLNSMTDEQKVGQIILGRFPSEGAENMIAEYHIGGFTLYADDFKNEYPETMSEKTAALQSASDIPLFLAADEEGGTVVRISKFPQYRLSPFSSQIALARDGEEAIREESLEKAELMLSLGINFNLAPVADITEDHSDYIYDRTFGESVNKTCEYITATVEAMDESNIASCLKHFPGYGSNVDTHTGSAEDNRLRSSFENTDFKPFQAGIEANAPSIMINHNIVTAFDDTAPASLSKEIHNVLRNELGFDGVILTDDLGMDAITEFAANSEESPYVLAVNAGNDLLCTSDIETAYKDVLEALSDGRIDRDKLDESVLRIVKMKSDYRIILFE